jgi:predicted transposase YbfD/YdcC
MSEPRRAVSLMEHFEDLKDPRREHGQEHKLIDLIVIGILAVICGANDCVGMEEFGQAKEMWLKTFLELPNGIASHDTFGRVFARLKPGEFRRCFINWVRAVAALTAGEIVAIDGKTVRRSYDRSGGQSAVELVSAWAQTNRLTLGQVKVAADSNEITAVPELLRLFDISGCIVTVDALNTQKENAQQIRAPEADYVLALKDNHPTLPKEVADFLEAAQQGRTLNDQISQHQTVDGEHGRIETRQYWQVEALPHLHEYDQWPDLRSVGLVHATREIGEKVTTQTRYYLSSLPVDARRFAEAVRGHWSVENSCHWVLDVVFREDDSRVRTGHAPENLGLLRRWVHSLLQQEPTAKVGVQNKRLKAAWDQQYLLKLLNPEKYQPL